MNTNNVSICIKRAEENQTEEYIKNAFKQYGNVSEVIFTPKTDQTGKKYNGVVVHFKNWFMTEQTKKIFDQLAETEGTPIKIYHDNRNMKFWYITAFETTEVTDLTQQMDQLTLSMTNNDVSSLMAQLYYLQKQVQKYEAQAIEYENKKTQDWLYNAELKHQLLEKDVEKQILEREKNKEIEELKWKNIELTMENYGLKDKIKVLEEELGDEKNITSFLYQEATEMKNMLRYSNK